MPMLQVKPQRTRSYERASSVVVRLFIHTTAIVTTTTAATDTANLRRFQLTLSFHHSYNAALSNHTTLHYLALSNSPGFTLAF